MICPALLVVMVVPILRMARMHWWGFKPRIGWRPSRRPISRHWVPPTVVIVAVMISILMVAFARVHGGETLLLVASMTGPVVHCPSTRSNKLWRVREWLIESFSQFELLIPMGIEDDPATIPVDFVHQSLLVNVDPAHVWLLDFVYIHEGKHGAHSFPHAVVALSSTSRAGFPVACNNVYALHRSKVLIPA